MIGNKPTIFVSSTCYDLRDARAALKTFCEDLGYQPFVSEFETFPVNPDNTAIENCLRVVDENADILLLVVGERYGTAAENDKSVTNREFLRARAKGIPIYAFVQKSVLNNLRVWQKSPDANFSGVADSPKLFEFVDSLLKKEEIWVFPFENVDDITSTLKIQLAYLFLDALVLRSRLKKVGLPPILAQLKGHSLRLAIERPKVWEQRLFASVLKDEIERVNQLKLDLKYGIALGEGKYLESISELL